MSKTKQILFILFYLQSQTLAIDNVNTAIDNIIFKSINASVEPCEDFYSYACGNYNEQTFFNAHFKNNNLLDYATHQYNTAIIDILDAYGGQKDQFAGDCQFLTEQIRNYFESCRKITKRNLTRYLEEMKPGLNLNWPILVKESSSEMAKWPPHGKDFDALRLIAKLTFLGIPIILMSTDFGHMRIALQPYLYLALPDKEKMLAMLSSMKIKDPTKIIEDVLEINSTLEGMLRDSKEHIYKPSEEASLLDIIERYPNINFKSYFREIKGKELPLNTTVIVLRSTFFQKLNERMPSLDKTKLCNYIMMYYLNRFDATTELNSMLCADELRSTFTVAINVLYYRQNSNYQGKLVKPDVTIMFETIVDMLRTHFQSHDLQLTIHQIELLRNKLAQLRFNVGNLPSNASCEKIANLYSGLPALDENNYYKNHLTTMRFFLISMLIDDFKQMFDSRPAITYSPYRKTITLTYAYLMPPVYDFNYSNLSKYSLLGYALAQQLVKYCGLATLNHEQKGEVSKPLQSALKCLNIKPYYDSSYPRLEDNVASEVIRKIVTLKFFNLQPINSVLTWKKRFFLNIGQHYCSKDNGADVLHDKKSDRLNRIVMNIEGFSQAFNCPEGSKMAPSEKCKIL